MAQAKNTNNAAAVKMNVLTGFHAIEEQLRSIIKNKTASSEYELCYSKAGPRVKKILGFAKANGIQSAEKSDKELNSLVAHLHETSQDHRGLVLVLKNEAQQKAQNFVEFDAFLAELVAKKKDGITVVLLDGVTDPHNVGAIIRNCDQLGASLLVIPEHGSVSESDVIARSSAGAASWIPVSIVSNLVRTVEKLQSAGFWTYAATAGGTPAHELDLKGNTAIVLGSEGSGISRLLAEKCDSIISIPTCGKLDSLNVSVATGVLLYEIHRQRLVK